MSRLTAWLLMCSLITAVSLIHGGEGVTMKTMLAFYIIMGGPTFIHYLFGNNKP